MSEYIIDMGNSSYKSSSGLLCADVSQLREEIVRCKDCIHCRTWHGISVNILRKSVVHRITCQPQRKLGNRFIVQVKAAISLTRIESCLITAR